MKNKKKATLIILLTITLCLLETIMELVIEPTYFIKSLIKIILFLPIPLLVFKLLKIKVFGEAYKIDKKRFIKLIGLGLFIYIVMMITYVIINNIYNFKDFVISIQNDQNINKKFFIFVTLYISFGNSLLEEFMFRQIAFLNLKKYIKPNIAYIFSSFMFGLYHLSMIGGSFPLPLILLSMFGLIGGALIFNWADDKNDNIYNSWIIHMFADFAIMTVWFIN